MKNSTCPGCGAAYNGRYCRSCGYEHFAEDTAHQKHSSAVPAPKKERKKHPLIRFLILLYLIYSLLPLLRQWGLKLEAMEDTAQRANSSYHSGEVPHG